jgi:hypothetical protein
MSDWRRKIGNLLPEYRYLIDHSASSEDLWRDLFQIALDRSADEAFLDRLVVCAVTVGGAQTAFLDPLLTHEGLRRHGLRHLSESTFLEAQVRLASSLSPAILAEMQNEFNRILEDRFRETPVGLLRKIKDDLIAASSEADQETIRRLWVGILSLVEAGEVNIGLDTFLDNLCEFNIAIPGHVEDQFRTLFSLYGKSLPDGC